MDTTINNPRLIDVKLIGAVDHPDFRDAVALFRATACCEINSYASPEVIIVAQSRPGQISQREIESLRLNWPLAGIVALLGSWCEGELRTGRPWPGVRRFYWYEFPAWWRLQLAHRNAGRCPEWARPTGDAFRPLPIRNPQCGLVHLRTGNRDTADILADVLHHAGYATVWNSPAGPKLIARGAVAGVWDGSQLNDNEAVDLAAFCRGMSRDAAPVIALLDFPRRECVERALQAGAAAVLGKPWLNADLITTLQTASLKGEHLGAA